jgi:plastocyanin
MGYGGTELADPIRAGNLPESLRARHGDAPVRLKGAGFKMREYPRSLGVLAVLLGIGVSPTVAQEVHEIRMVSDGKGEFRFAPASVSARRGDILLFKAVSGAPHSVVFEGKGLPDKAREKLNAALPRRAGDLSSPLLTEGSEYRIAVPFGIAGGTYRFFCLPHRAYDMRGEVIVK